MTRQSERDDLREIDVLIVDDDPLMRRMLSRALQPDAYNIVLAVDGDAAWSHVQRNEPSLIVTDWEMPGLSGPELVRRVRAADGVFVYIILLTLRSGMDDILEGLEAGADDYLTKPVDPRQLRARVAIGKRMIQLEDRLRRLAYTDDLTGLLSRRAVDEHGQAELARSARNGIACSIALIDVDRFKRVNDTYGHDSGDSVLKDMAAVFSENSRSYDRVGRWGGDEFLIVLPETSLAEASDLANRICVAVRRVVLPDGSQMSVSIGVAGAAPGESKSLKDLLTEADSMLFLAKHRGGGGTSVAPVRGTAA